MSTVAVLTAAALLGGAPAVGAATKHAEKHKSCMTLLPNAIDASAITGLATKLKVQEFKSGGAYYKPPSWACEFIATKPPWPAVEGVTTTYIGAVEADYQSSKHQFAEIRQGDVVDGSTLGPSPQYVTVSTVHVGHKSLAAFVEKDNIWGYYQMTPGEYPGIPQYVYEINVLTKHDNILYLFFYNANLKQTENLAKGILSLYGSWF